MDNILNSFEFTKILGSDPHAKTIAVLGSVDGKDCIISLEKSAFKAKASAYHSLSSLIKKAKVIQQNDIYTWNDVTLSQDVILNPGAKLNVIYPATETHIRKYNAQIFHYVRESFDAYKKFVVPYIETMKGDRIKWVYNILFNGKEKESVIYHDEDPLTGFVLLPDMKWDAKTLDSLYLCAIVNRTDILSVRDLNGSHLDYLINIQNQIRKVVAEKYPIGGDQVRIFIHYQPSYYHFHIHVVTLKHQGLGSGINVGKAILLDDVIENIKMNADYYQTRTLGYVIGESHELWTDEFAEATKP